MFACARTHRTDREGKGVPLFRALAPRRNDNPQDRMPHYCE